MGWKSLGTVKCGEKYILYTVQWTKTRLPFSLSGKYRKAACLGCEIQESVGFLQLPIASLLLQGSGPWCFATMGAGKGLQTYQESRRAELTQCLWCLLGLSVVQETSSPERDPSLRGNVNTRFWRCSGIRAIITLTSYKVLVLARQNSVLWKSVGRIRAGVGKVPGDGVIGIWRGRRMEERDTNYMQWIKNQYRC